MIDVSIDLRGAEQAIAKLSRADADKALNRIVTKIAIVAENEGKKRSPVDTGRLRASMVHKVNGTSGWAGTNVHYAIYLNSPVTRNPHYRRGPFAGASTAGWLTEHAYRSTQAQVDGIVASEVGSLWG